VLHTLSAGLILNTLSIVLFSPLTLAVDRVTVGLSSTSSVNGAIWVAEERGLFKKHGIDINVANVGGGAARAISAMVGGDIQFATAGGAAAISAALAGADVVMVASILNKGVQKLLARPPVKDPKELIGKKIGVVGFGSASHTVLLILLQKWSIPADKVQLVQWESSPSMLVALDKGIIDAGVFTEPSVFIGEEKGYNVLADLVDMDIYYLHNMLAVTRSYLRSHNEAATGFIKGYVEGVAYFKKNKKDSLEVLKKKLRIEPQQEKYLEKSYDLFASYYYDKTPIHRSRVSKPCWSFSPRTTPRPKEPIPTHSLTRALSKILIKADLSKSCTSNALC
jgi:ABC-type nitrate/sulfonate/bicarbonate transport system substrate-binding protein